MSWIDRLVGCIAVPMIALATLGCGSSGAAARDDAGGLSDAASAPDVPSELDTAGMPDTGTPETGMIPVVGLWVGTTSQGLPIRIAIDAGITALEFGWSVPICSSTTSVMFGAPVPIVDGAFSRTIPGGPGGVRGEIEGQFTSERMLSGTLVFTVVPIPGVPSCSGSDAVTYTATPG